MLTLRRSSAVAERENLQKSYSKVGEKMAEGERRPVRGLGSP
jgi:hypothetical protein